MLSKLSKDEKIGLAGVLKWVVSADPQDSLEGVSDFFKENNFGDFNAIFDEMNDLFKDIEELQDFLTKIDDVSAQKLIFKVAKDIALSDAMITNREKEVFEFLKNIWNIEMDNK